mmetsp:Transcript_39230/g.77188  ORF Transcript_39230/g.77188 Transcript_39230/m.77188 type:complete len:90 (+) Transcript_39230:561-830(+)
MSPKKTTRSHHKKTPTDLVFPFLLLLQKGEVNHSRPQTNVNEQQTNERKGQEERSKDARKQKGTVKTREGTWSMKDKQTDKTEERGANS